MDDCLTVTEFAARMRVSRAAVYQWLEAMPDLRPRKIGGLTLLSPADQERLRTRPRKKLGRPKKELDTVTSAA